MGVFDDWQEGVITDHAALYALCADLGGVETQLEPLQAQREVLRSAIGKVLARLGGREMVPGFGRLELTAPSIVRGYDRKRLDELIITLTTREPEIAAQIAQCRTETQRAGGLRIERERPR